MKITKEILYKTAHLARLHVTDDKADQMINDLQKMVDWVDKLKELDTKGVEPLTGMSFESNRFREDKSDNQLSNEQVFKNAPKHDTKYFRVPKVIK